MRKILLLLFFGCLASSCSESMEYSKPDSNLGAVQKQADQNCTQVFVLNTESLPSGWDTDVTICESTATEISASLVNLSEDDKVMWLKKYGDYINYKVTYPYIEGAHVLQYQGNEQLLQSTDFDLASIETNLQIAGSSMRDDNYDHYVKLTMDSSGNGSVSISKNYVSSPNIACYSIPFFRSIIAQHHDNLPSNPVFTFSKTLIGGTQKIFLRVRKTDNTFQYYDYSDEPGHG